MNGPFVGAQVMGVAEPLVAERAPVMHQVRLGQARSGQVRSVKLGHC